MAIFTHQGVGISGLAAAVPANIYNNLTDNKHFSLNDLNSITEKIGVRERRVAPRDMCASDLGFAAAKALIRDCRIPLDSIDALIFVSQTPDYRMPATGIIMQDRLGLSKHCSAFDVNLGCSGFVYGLNMAYLMAAQASINRVLLINAETRTKVYSFRDRKTGLLFGDAATACLIEKDEKMGPSWFILDSDGSKSDFIKIKSGGYRFPSDANSFIETEREYGAYRSDEQGIMDGSGVFEFVISEVPKQVKKVLEISELRTNDVDFFMFHQANQFMNSHLVKKLKLSPDTVPSNIDRFGNTSSVSIPLTIVSELQDKLGQQVRLLICGFGVGLSIGSAIINVDNPTVSKLVEV